MDSPGKTSHSDQARAAPINAAHPEATSTTMTNKEFLFFAQSYSVCLFTLLPKSMGKLFPK